MIPAPAFFQALKIPQNEWELIQNDAKQICLAPKVTLDTVIFGLEDPSGILINNKHYRPNTGLVSTQRKQRPNLTISEALELIQVNIYSSDIDKLLSSLKQVTLLLNKYMHLSSAHDDVELLITELDLLYAELGMFILPSTFLSKIVVPITFTKFCAPNLGKYIVQQLN